MTAKYPTLLNAALADYTKGLQSEDSAGYSDTLRTDHTSAVPSALQGQPTKLRDEPDLIASIASQAQDATTQEGANKFSSAAAKLGQAYEQVCWESLLLAK